MVSFSPRVRVFALGVSNVLMFCFVQFSDYFREEQERDFQEPFPRSPYLYLSRMHLLHIYLFIYFLKFTLLFYSSLYVNLVTEKTEERKRTGEEVRKFVLLCLTLLFSF